jgi:hypothetical protein
VQRLRLIRALTDVGGLSLAAVGNVLAAVDNRESGHHTMGVVQTELAGSPPEVDAETADWALTRIRAAAAAAGWPEPHPWQVPVADLIATLATARELGRPELTEHLADYAGLAARAAELDLATAAGLTSVDRIVETAVLVLILGDRVFADLRHLAQENLSRVRLNDRPAQSQATGSECTP